MVRFILIVILVGWGVFKLVIYIPDSQLHIVFCDVGQGDATLISLNSTQVLIDGGRDAAVLECLHKHLPPWDRLLEVVVATHPDADHINGLVPVMENYAVGTLLHNGQSKETADFNRFKDVLQKLALQGGTVMVGHSGQRVKIGNYADLSVLYPLLDESIPAQSSTNVAETILSDVKTTSVTDNYNNSSIVLMLKYGQLDMLFMGDLEKEGEEALIDRGLIAQVEVLKVGHHGAKTSSTREFIDLTQPEISVISAGKNNSYGHPHPLVIERLTQVGSVILRTDQDSTIELVSNGTTISRKNEHVWFK